MLADMNVHVLLVFLGLRMTTSLYLSTILIVGGPHQALFLECFFTSVYRHFILYEDFIFKSMIVEEERIYEKTNQRQTRTCFKPLHDLHRGTCFSTMVLNIFAYEMLNIIA